MARLTDTRVAAIKPPATGQEEHPDDLVRGLRLRVGAGGRKSWIVRTRAGAKVLNKTLGAYPVLSLGKAREEAQAFLLGIATDGAPRAERTFGDLAADWLKRVAKEKNRSWRLQERALEIHVLPKWRSRVLDTIRRADVRDLIEGIEGEVAPNRVLSLVKTIFRHALALDWLEASPADAIAKPKAESSRERVLGMAEVKRIYEAADLLGYPFGGYMKMLFLTGQRRTEVASMRWCDIDLEQGSWTIAASTAKANRAHLVPLPAAAVAILKAAPRLGEFVWSNDGKSHVSGFSKAKTRLDAFLGGIGAALEPWVLHDARRTVATHMVRLGVPELVVGRVLNHAVTGVTGRVYALHAYAPEKRNALDRWAAELLRELAGRKPGKVIKLRAGE